MYRPLLVVQENVTPQQPTQRLLGHQGLPGRLQQIDVPQTARGLGNARPPQNPAFPDQNLLLLKIDPAPSGSLRDIDLLEPVREALLAQKALSWLLGGYVFLDGKQQPVNQELFRMKVWEPLLKRLGVRYRPPYQMRHTFATLAISAGENINWVARMLGHKSPVITLERYNRFVPNLTRTDGKALLAAGRTGERFPVIEKINT
jgi:hypothetical protein